MRYKRLLNKYKAPLKVFWWRNRFPSQLNFGDEITPIIIESIWGRDCLWTDISECELAGAGSIIEMLDDRVQENRIKVWGSGFIKDGPKLTNKHLDFYAIRGPLSLGRIKNTHDVALGDPGLLANLVFPPSPSKNQKIGIVPHYVDVDSVALKKILKKNNYRIINVFDSPAEVAEQITACEIIFSSSLHGLIFADSYGIPNYWLSLSDKLTGGDYKFRDYYMSTKRPVARIVPEVLEKEKSPKEIDSLIQNYQPIKNLSSMQRKLIKSFPF